MNQVTLPDGSQLSSTELSLDQIQQLFQQVTCGMLGIFIQPTTAILNLTANSFTATTTSLLGIYAGEAVTGTGIAAGTLVTGTDPNTNTVYLSLPATASGAQACTFTDTLAYSKVRVGWQKEGQPTAGIDTDVCYLRATEKDGEYNRIREGRQVAGGDSNHTVFQTNWTRVWEITWELWGPNSYANGNLIRNVLMLDSSFAADALSSSNLYLVPDIARVERVPQKIEGQWWPTAYISAEFYEAVQQTVTTPVGKSVEAIVSDAAGVLIDKTIQL